MMRWLIYEALADNVDGDALLTRILNAISLPEVTPNDGNFTGRTSHK